YAAYLGIELAVVECHAPAPDFVEFAFESTDVSDRFGCADLEVSTGKKAIELIGAQCRQDDLAERGAMGWPDDAHSVGELECSGAGRSRNHHDGISHAHRKVAAFTRLPRQILENWRRQAHHLNLVERTCGEGEERAANPISLAVLDLADVAQRH